MKGKSEWGWRSGRWEEGGCGTEGTREEKGDKSEGKKNPKLIEST